MLAPWCLILALCCCAGLSRRRPVEKRKFRANFRILRQVPALVVIGQG